MEKRDIEIIISNAIAIGCIQTLSQLGLFDENVTEKQAHKMYGKKLVQEWRHRRWIVGYPSGNSARAKFFFKRSELETASRMLDINNIISPPIIFRKTDQAEIDKTAIRIIQKRVK